MGTSGKAHSEDRQGAAPQHLAAHSSAPSGCPDCQQCQDHASLGCNTSLDLQPAAQMHPALLLERQLNACSPQPKACCTATHIQHRAYSRTEVLLLFGKPLGLVIYAGWYLLQLAGSVLNTCCTAL